MRPFSTFGVRPFLWSTSEDDRMLQRTFYELSARYHPDRAVGLPAAEREALEDQSAQLNRDYAQLKDFWRRLEAVLSAEREENPSARRNSAPPPELAESYFELQEQQAERGPRDAQVLAAAQKLGTELRAHLARHEEAVRALARAFPFSPTDGAPPWTAEDLAALKAAVEKVRFDRSFLRDLEAKFSAF